MKLSIIVPVLNEINYIEKLAESLNKPDEISKEIIFVDGGSNDGTVNKIKDLELNHSNIKLVKNPDKFVSQAFNRAYPISVGNYLGLLGAHAEYSDNYFECAINYLDKDECDAIGGTLIQNGNSKLGKAIAYCMSSKFGVGNTSVRTEKKKKYVQSAAFAIYKREIFEKVGFFDEELIRNQDDEFHYRLNRAGFRMLLTPEISAKYYVRNTLKGLYKQYYNYGYYKPLVLKKVPESLRPRHLIPACFVLYLFSLFLAMFSYLWLIPLVFYFLFLVYFSFRVKNNWSTKFLSMIVFPTLHFSYGIGFLVGLINAFKKRN